MREIQDALLSAYPTENDLAQLVRFELDFALSSIASGGNQTELIFQLLNWAESQGSLERLLVAAIQRNSGNPALQKVAAKLLLDDQNQIDTAVQRQEKTPSSDAPFLGPVPFSASDATIFFGRDAETEIIVRRIVKDKLLVINGRSGSGKTSILRAAVIPRIEAQGGLVIYASILDSPRSDVVRAIEGKLSQNYITHEDIVAALNDVIHPSVDAPVVLVVDQLERCFAASTPPDERNLFWRDVARIINHDTRKSVHLVLVVRADWLYAFQTAVPFSEIVPVFSFIYLIEPLTAQQAVEALSGPLTLFGVTGTESVTEKIIDDLKDSDGFVNPPQLQVVGAAIYEHLREKQCRGGTLELTLADYEQLDGTSTILRQHLLKIVRFFGPKERACWQILSRLVSEDNLRVSKQEADLSGNLSEAEFRPIINALVRNALVMRDISRDDNTPVYILTHDYLVGEIKSHFEKDHRLQALRTGEDYLNAGLRDLRRAVQSRSQEFIPMERERYFYIWENRDLFEGISPEAALFLTKSALYYGEASFAHWFGILPEAEKRVAACYLAMLCTEQDSSVSEQRLSNITTTVSKHVLAPDRKIIQDALWPIVRPTRSALSSPAPPVASRQVESSTKILWAMRHDLRSGDVAALLPTMTRLWLRRHRSSLTFMGVGAAVVLAALLVFLWVRDRMIGYWVPLPPLYAGHIAAAALSPRASGEFYVATQRGRERSDGATIIHYSTAEKERNVIGRNLAQQPIQSMLTVEDNGILRLYASVWGQGILQWSEDQVEWRMVNRGLSSYDIRSLAADPTNPQHIYAAAANFGGVFESLDSGENWQDVSGESLFGVSVSAVATSPYEDSVLSGTYDGRIFYRSEDEEEWTLTAAFPGEGTITVIAPEPTGGQFIYAGTATGSVYLSGDGGKTWSWMSKIPGIFVVNSIAVTPGSPDTVYADAFGPGGNIVWISRDYGSTWEMVPNSAFSREYKRLMTDPRDASALYAFGIAGIFSSYDQGKTWRYEQELGAPLAAVGSVAVSSLPGGATYLTVSGSIFTSVEQDIQNWVRSEALPASSVRVIIPDPVEPATAFAGIYIPNRWSVYVTTNNGRSWKATSVPSSIPQRLLNDTTALAVLWDGSDHIVYAGTNGCGVIRSNDGGKSWDTFGRTDCDLPPNAPKNLIDLTIAPDQPDKLYAVADGSLIYVSNDAGQHWTVHSIDGINKVNGLLADPVVRKRLYLIAGADGFWRSDDDGQSWRKLSRSLNGQIMVDMVYAIANESLFVASSDGQVFQSRDGGENWQSTDRSLTASNGTGLAYDVRTRELVLSTLHEGLYKFIPGSLIRQ